MVNIPEGWEVGLKTVDKNGLAYGGFQWPTDGPFPVMVTAPDWNPLPQCGGGLHLLPRGVGDSSLLDWSEGAIWLAVAYNPSEMVDLKGKVKVPICVLLMAGTKQEITTFVAGHNPGQPVVGAVIIMTESRQNVVVGDNGTATAGYRGVATAGDNGTATAGYKGVATAGDNGTAAAGSWGVATAGYRGVATAGNGGTATAGDNGTATAGDGGTATARLGGVVAAGNLGVLILKDYDSRGRLRLHVAYVGENNILPNVQYRLNDDCKFEAVK